MRWLFVLAMLLSPCAVGAVVMTPNTSVRVDYDFSSVETVGVGTFFNDLIYAFKFSDDAPFKMGTTLYLDAFDSADHEMGSVFLRQPFLFDVNNVSSSVNVLTTDLTGHLLITSVDATLDITGVSLLLAGDGSYRAAARTPFADPLATTFNAYPDLPLLPLAPVPEPSTWAMLLLGLFCMAARHKRLGPQPQRIVVV
ncbi:PEP-CTERM protein-sorting domain-containing protein [Bradyrhizobium lablabi]|nr:PEP-CTERM protein-sorting domain-containing protein [Bradyrhizobium lablabi]